MGKKKPKNLGRQGNFKQKKNAYKKHTNFKNTGSDQKGSHFG